MPAKFPFVLRRRFDEIRARYRHLSSEHDSLSVEHGRVTAERNSLREAMALFQAMVDQVTAATDRLNALSREADSTTRLLSELSKVFSRVHLLPVATCRNTSDWDLFLSSVAYERLNQEDEAILGSHQFEEVWTLPGYSVTAREFVNFEVDNLWGGKRNGNRFFPNIRERFVCPISHLNNRQRLMAALIANELAAQGDGCSVYFMEQVTPIYMWALKSFGKHTVTGSEYLGHDLSAGQIVDGLRHEDVHHLSFESSSHDLIVSNEVMEHVPWPRRAFEELARVLRPGGTALMTFPFHAHQAKSLVRAELIDGKEQHYLQPEYHGNPVSAEGSLVYTDFGWDLMDLIREAGFRDVALEIYHSAPMGHLGANNLVFRIIR
jgi:SAM-dependent methyltransferase